MKLLAVIVACLVLTAGCSSSAAGHATKVKPTHPAAAATVYVTGTVVVAGADAYRADDPPGSQCWTSGNSPAFPSPGPLDDVKAGAQVVVADDTGKTVGIGKLTDGATTRQATTVDHPPCAFPFTVSGVPSGSRFYKITVGSHSMQIPGTSLSRPITVSLS